MKKIATPHLQQLRNGKEGEGEEEVLPPLPPPRPCCPHRPNQWVVVDSLGEGYRKAVSGVIILEGSSDWGSDIAWLFIRICCTG